ncbi:MAG: hypothetical protein AB1Z98_03720 [Nannocystaceae bacterium]
MGIRSNELITILAISAAFVLPACGGNDNDDLGVGGGDSDGGGDGDGDGGGQGMQEPDPTSVDLPDPGDFTYSAEHVFSMDDVVGDFDGLTAAEDPSIVCVECEPRQDGSASLYPVDNAFGFTAIDFVGAMPRPRDGNYHDGFIGDVHDPDSGEHQGIAVSSEATTAFRTGARAGAWCAGAGGDLVKCSTEHFTTMEHILTCDETVPYWFYDAQSGEPNDPVWEACEPLDLTFDVDPAELDPYQFDLDQIAIGSDFGVTQKDDGKVLYRWGTWDKRPTDMRLAAHIPLPEEWKGTELYRVTRAQLALVHTVSNSPNDQIRPEGMENEAATGRKPSYEVLDDGRWVSTVDCYEGDGDFIPAGTTLRNPPFADPDGLSSDLRMGYTNAWYTTTDREPFDTDPVTGAGPRWRFQSSKFGQDLPGVEIPAVNCQPPPLRKGENKYDVGEVTVTIINLLDWAADEDSPLLTSRGWMSPTVQAMSETYENVTADGLRLTEDFDLGIYVKGEYKPSRLYRAVLYIDYEAM